MAPVSTTVTPVRHVLSHHCNSINRGMEVWAGVTLKRKLKSIIFTRKEACNSKVSTLKHRTLTAKYRGGISGQKHEGGLRILTAHKSSDENNIQSYPKLLLDPLFSQNRQPLSQKVPK